MLWECHSLNKCYKFAICLNWMCILPSLKPNQRPCRKNQIPPPKSWIFSGFRDARSLVFCMVFCISLLVFFLLAIACLFSFGHCIVFSLSICGFRLPLWDLQTFSVGPISILQNSHKGMSDWSHDWSQRRLTLTMYLDSSPAYPFPWERYHEIYFYCIIKIVTMFLFSILKERSIALIDPYTDLVQYTINSVLSLE